MKLTKSEILTIRSKTNNNEFAKQSFYLLQKDENDTALAIRKLVLTKDFKDYEKYGYENIKTFNDMALVKQSFSIKIKTLQEVLNWMNNLKNL